MVAVLQSGRIIDVGTTEQLFRPPLHEYTKLLMSSVPQMRPGWLEEALEARANRPGGAVMPPNATKENENV